VIATQRLTPASKNPTTVDWERKDLGFNASSTVLSTYFAHAPLAHAVFRGAEALALSVYPLQRPVLDLGCGAGEFASHAVSGVVDVGLDICGNQLVNAERTRKYARMVQADARCLPLSGETFGTVLSVSALEHFADPETVLAEVHRVLRPGGTFVGTVVLADLHEHLFYPRLLRWLGLRQLARWYEAAQDRWFNHRTLLTKEDWETLFARHGLRLQVCKRILSPGLTQWWDMLLAAALPGRLLRRYLVWRPRWVARRLARWLEPHLRAEQEQGSVLFFVAEKPATEVAAKAVNDWLATCDERMADFIASAASPAPSVVLAELLVQ
jgi:SAM-dependent methyltransferase